MNDDFSELIEYLDKKFLDIDGRFEYVDRKLQDTASKKDVEELNEKFDRVLNSLDKLTKLMETYHQEQAAMGAKLDRHEEWIKQIAEKVGVKLSY